MHMQAIEIDHLHVPNFEGVPVLDDYVIHVQGPEIAEILRDGNEVHGGALLKLKKVRVIVVTLPTQ